jgi:hypothetical protein
MFLFLFSTGTTGFLSTSYRFTLFSAFLLGDFLLDSDGDLFIVQFHMYSTLSSTMEVTCRMLPKLSLFVYPVECVYCTEPEATCRP